MTADQVRVTSDGLLLGDRVVRLLSGEVHPWRHDVAEWEVILDAVQDLGFQTVSCYLSWARHEQAAGHFSWSGSLDIVDFLERVHRRGMLAVVRIGPNSAAEQEDSGWPRRVLDDPRCQARRPGGAPYVLATSTHQAYMPSYGSRCTLEHVAAWYDQVVPRLAPLQWPAGPVVACQVDNEMGYHFQSHAFALDYHPDTVLQYREFLADCYGSVLELNLAYGTAYDSFAAVLPPTDGSCQPEVWRVDWVRFREHHLRRTLSYLAGAIRDCGMDRVPLVHNDYPRTTTPLDVGALEASGAVDVAGADIYTTKEGGRFVRELARHLAGSSRLPYLAELGTGWLTLPWLLPMNTTPLDEEHAALRAWIHGARAANVYMLVERDRWYGSPISAHGDIRELKGQFYRRLHALLDEVQWHTLRRDAPVLIVENRDVSRRVAARAVLGDVVPCFSQLLPVDMRLFVLEDDEADQMAEFDRAVVTELDRLGVEADRAASSSLPCLDGYPVVVVFQPEKLADEPRRRLAGARVVSDPAELRRVVPVPAFGCLVPELDVVRLTGSGREVLAAVNNSAEPITTTLTCEGDVHLRGLWLPEERKGVGCVEVSVPAWAVQVWEVIR